MLSRILSFLLISFLVVGAQASLSWGYKIGPVNFPDNHQLKEESLSLRGAGLKKLLGLQIAAVALYTPLGIASDEVLSNIPKRLEIVYLQDIPKQELDQATITGVKVNVSKDEYQKLEPKIQEINNKYENVKKGDKIIVDYFPGIGLEVSVKNKFKGIVPGDDMARAFFAIWVGGHPVDSHIKSLLLG